jgi:hypothetical protein
MLALPLADIRQHCGDGGRRAGEIEMSALGQKRKLKIHQRFRRYVTHGAGWLKPKPCAVRFENELGSPDTYDWSEIKTAKSVMTAYVASAFQNTSPVWVTVSRPPQSLHADIDIEREARPAWHEAPSD